MNQHPCNLPLKILKIALVLSGSVKLFLVVLLPFAWKYPSLLPLSSFLLSFLFLVSYILFLSHQTPTADKAPATPSLFSGKFRYLCPKVDTSSSAWRSWPSSAPCAMPIGGVFPHPQLVTMRGAGRGALGLNNSNSSVTLKKHRKQTPACQTGRSNNMGEQNTQRVSNAECCGSIAWCSTPSLVGWSTCIQDADATDIHRNGNGVWALAAVLFGTAGDGWPWNPAFARCLGGPTAQPKGNNWTVLTLWEASIKAGWNSPLVVLVEKGCVGTKLDESPRGQPPLPAFPLRRRRRHRPPGAGLLRGRAVRPPPGSSGCLQPTAAASSRSLPAAPHSPAAPRSAGQPQAPRLEPPGGRCCCRCCRAPGRLGSAPSSRLALGADQLWHPKLTLPPPRWWPRITLFTLRSRGRIVPWTCRQRADQLKRRR